GIDSGYLSKLERGKLPAGADVLNKYASAFDGLEVQDLTKAPRQRPAKPLRYEKNPKPVRLGGLVLENVYLLVGNHTEPLDFSVRYRPQRLSIPPDVRPHFSDLVAI